MKKLLPLIVLLTLSTLLSCGRSPIAGSRPETSSEQQLTEDKSGPFLTPAIGFHRAITLDPSIKGLYENLTVNPKKEGEVLGDCPFYVMANENFHSFTEYNLGFYDGIKVKNIYSIDKILDLQAMTYANLKKLVLNDVSDLMRADLIWGKRNLDQPEMDMLNKGYVIMTEAMDQQSGKEFKSLSTYLVWFECEEGQLAMKDNGYTCAKFNLKFHYKLLDYQLKERTL